MERLIIEAYDDAKSNELFAITTMLERLINRRYSCSNLYVDITTGQVRQVLESRGMSYTIASDKQEQDIDMGRYIYRKTSKLAMVLK